VERGFVTTTLRKGGGEKKRGEKKNVQSIFSTRKKGVKVLLMGGRKGGGRPCHLPLPVRLFDLKEGGFQKNRQEGVERGGNVRDREQERGREKKKDSNIFFEGGENISRHFLGEKKGRSAENKKGGEKNPPEIKPSIEREGKKEPPLPKRERKEKKTPLNILRPKKRGQNDQ